MGGSGGTEPSASLYKRMAALFRSLNFDLYQCESPPIHVEWVVDNGACRCMPSPATSTRIRRCPMKALSRFAVMPVLFVALALIPVTARAADNPALWKYQTKGKFSEVVAHLKHGLLAAQFQITAEEHLSKGLENNKHLFPEGQVEHHRLRQRDRDPLLLGGVQPGGVQRRSRLVDSVPVQARGLHHEEGAGGVTVVLVNADLHHGQGQAPAKAREVRKKIEGSDRRGHQGGARTLRGGCIRRAGVTPCRPSRTAAIVAKRKGSGGAARRISRRRSTPARPPVGRRHPSLPRCRP